MEINPDMFLKQAYSLHDGGKGVYEPVLECHQWDATGECTGYQAKPPEVGGYEPVLECQQWDATGECTGYQAKPPEVGGYEPVLECQQWDATGECTGYQAINPSNPDVPFLSASVGSFPTTAGIPAPLGFQAEIITQNTQETLQKAGQNPSTLNQSVEKLVLTNWQADYPAKTSIGDGFEEADRLQNSWSRAAERAFPQEIHWGLQQNIEGAGSVGNLISIYQETSQYTGGAHPNNEFGVATYDQEGNRIRLESLLTPEQMTDVVDDVAAALVVLEGPGDLNAAGLFAGADKQILREQINDHFALQREEDGVRIRVGLSSGIHALGNPMAVFEFAAPTDEHFRRATGQSPTCAR